MHQHTAQVFFAPLSHLSFGQTLRVSPRRRNPFVCGNVQKRESREEVLTLPGWESPYFRLKELDTGVWAAIEAYPGSTNSNAGFVDLGDSAVVFDAFFDLDAAADLKRLAETITGHPVSALVNSHFHLDHVLGNQAFSRHIPLISTPIMRQCIIARTLPDVPYPDAGKDIGEIEAELAKETNPQKRDRLEDIRSQLVHLKRPGLQLRVPDTLFEGKLTIVGSKRTVELVEIRDGHTPSDVVMLLPEQQIAFMGDLLFTRMHPWLGAGDPWHWADVLKDFEARDYVKFVAGHGEPGTIEDLATERRYIETIISQVQGHITSGGDREGLENLVIPEEFKDWNASMYLLNVQSVYDRLAPTRSGSQESGVGGQER
jgi:glyoxylase-like metal-dependent hydrolase (beta-lactamase superfamily II)